MAEQLNVDEIQNIANKMRLDVIEMTTAAGSGHPGGSLSAADAVAALYFRIMNIDPADPYKDDRDRFVLSKGHAAPILYAALAERGYFPTDELKLKSTQGLSLAMSRLTVVLLLVGLLIIVLALLAVVLIQWLGRLTGSLAVASSIVCGFFVLVLAVVFFLRKRLFRDTFVKLFIGIFYGDDQEA